MGDSTHGRARDTSKEAMKHATNDAELGGDGTESKDRSWIAILLGTGPAFLAGRRSWRANDDR